MAERLPRSPGPHWLADVKHSCRALGFCLIALLPAAAGSQAPPIIPALYEADFEFPDGDEVFATARLALERAPTEPKRLEALYTVVNLQRRRGDYVAGLAAAREGYAKARELENLMLQVDFLYLQGRLYWNLSDFPQSLEIHLRELKLAETMGDPFRLARTHGGLGLTYHRFGRNEDALHHFELGLAFAAEAKDERIRASILNSLGNYHLGERDYDRAAKIHLEALRIREGFGNHRAVAGSLTNLALIADARGEPAQALDYLLRALQTYESLKYRRYIANTHRRLAPVLRRLERGDEALGHLDAALEIATGLGSAEVLAEIFHELALTHEALGDPVKALEFERRFAAVREEMRNERDRQSVAELRARYGEEQRELEITLLKQEQELQQSEIRRRRFQNQVLAGILVGGVGLLGVTVFVQLARLRAEKRLRTANQHARERAESADRLKTRLLQMASHDLKVPLTSLHAAATLIGDADGVASSVRHLAAGIQADASRMRVLVRDFLDAAAREDGNLQLHLKEIDIAALVRTATDQLQPVAAQKRQHLRCISASRLPAVKADPDRLHQVFDNLIGNALKFTPPGGAISIRFGTAGGWVFVEVCDSGPGFGPEEFARIFSQGESLSARPTGEEESTGLGLFIARELLTLQGGRLEVQSKPGAGAVFRVLLPEAMQG